MTIFIALLTGIIWYLRKLQTNSVAILTHEQEIILNENESRSLQKYLRKDRQSSFSPFLPKEHYLLFK